MKKTLLSLAVGAAVLLTACGQSNTDAGFTQADLSLTIAGAQYQCNMDIASIIADLGEDYEYSEGMSCDYDGLDKTFGYDVAMFYTNPLAQGDMVNEIYTKDPAVSTSKGIAVGATVDEVVAAYGDDYEDGSGLMIYRLEGELASLCFEIEDGAVWAIFLTTQPV